MKKLISIALAAIILSTALAPASSAQKKAPSAFEYDKICETAGFLGSFFWGWDDYNFHDCLFAEAAELFPGNVTYRKNEYGTYPESITLSEDMLKIAFDSRYPYAPINLFGTQIIADYSKYYVEAEGMYVIPYPGGKGGTVIFDPQIVGFAAKENGNCDVFLAKPEMLMLPAEAYPDPYSYEFEYDGRTYYDGPEGFFAYGDLLPLGYRIELAYTEDGVILCEAEMNVSIPECFDEAPAPDGDVNGDGKINARDVIAIMNAVLGKHGEKFSFYCADVYTDDKLNARDVQKLMRSLLP